MNRTEIIEKIIERFKCEPYEAPLSILKQILSEELPDFQRIDWERLRDCFEKASNGYVSSHLYVAVKEYNSTLPPALKCYDCKGFVNKEGECFCNRDTLQPLPKEMPLELLQSFYNNDTQTFWSALQYYYGTPANKLQPLPDTVDLKNDIWGICGQYANGTPEPKPQLPNVEELEKELSILWGKDIEMIQRGVAKYFHSKYSLHTREEKGFPFNLKEGDQVRCQGVQYTVDHIDFCIVSKYGILLPIQDCTPYVSAQEIIAKHNLSEEEIKIIKQS